MPILTINLGKLWQRKWFSYPNFQTVQISVYPRGKEASFRIRRTFQSLRLEAWQVTNIRLSYQVEHIESTKKKHVSNHVPCRACGCKMTRWGISSPRANSNQRLGERICSITPYHPVLAILITVLNFPGVRSAPVLPLSSTSLHVTFGTNCSRKHKQKRHWVPSSSSKMVMLPSSSKPHQMFYQNNGKT